MTRLPFFLLALSLVVLIPARPLSAATYLKVPPTNNYTYGTIYNAVNVQASDDAYAVFPRTTQSNGNHAIGSRGFATGYKENTHGYIADVQYGMEYHLYAAPFSNDYMEGWYSVNKGSSWTSTWFGAGNRPVVDATVVAPGPDDGSNDCTYTRSYTNQSGMNTWEKIDMNRGTTGLYSDICWYKMPSSSPLSNVDNTQIYIDYIYINVLTKLTVLLGSSLATGSRTQGSTDVPLMSMVLKPYSNLTFNINSIRVDFLGTVAGSDAAATSAISNLKLYRDINANDILDAGDVLLGTKLITGRYDQIISGSPLIANPMHASRYIFAVDIKDTAPVGQTIGMRLTDQTDFTPADPADKVASNTDRTNVTASDREPAATAIWPVQTSTTVTISQKATLSASFQLPATSTVTKGDNFTVRLRITNAGGAGTAVNVLPSALSISGTGNAVTSTTNQIPVTLAGGASADFDWEYTAIASGTVQFSGQGTGTDENSGKAVSSAAASSNTVTIDPATVAILQITDFSVSPLTVSDDNQTIAVNVTVQNVGDMTANDVSIQHFTDGTNWNLEVIGSGTVSDVSAAQTPQDILPGNSWTFPFQFQATGAGQLQFKCRADGSNTNPVSSASANILIEAQAALAHVSILTSPSGTIGKGATFTLVHTVQNTGGAAALNVVPAALSVNPVLAGDPPPEVKSGPNPASIASLAGGTSAQFSWVLYSRNDNALGKYNFSSSVSYADANSAKSRTGGYGVTADVVFDNIITPLAENATSSQVRKAISYSYDSDYYVLNEAGLLYAYNSLGVEKWNYNLALDVTVPGEAFFNTDEAVGTVLWFGSNNGRVYAIVDNESGPTGYYNPTIANSWISLSTGDSVTEFPIVWGDYIWCPAGNRVTKRLKNDGTVAPFWVDYVAPNTVTTPLAVDNNYVYFGCSNGRSYCLNATTGALVSQSADHGNAITSAPMVWANHVYTANSNGAIIRYNQPNNLGNADVVDMDGGTNSIISDVWVGLYSDYVWCASGANSVIYKRNFSDLSAAATRTFTGETIYAPLEYNGKVYFGARTGVGTGKVYVIQASDLLDYGLWPYLKANPFSTTMCLDPFNSVFLSGCDNNNVYFFSLPE